MIASSSSAPTRRQRSGRRHARDQPIVLLRTKPSDNSTRQVMRVSTPSPRLLLGLRPGPPKFEIAYSNIFTSRAVDQVRHRRDNFDREVLDRTSARASPAAQLQDRAAAASRCPRSYNITSRRGQTRGSMCCTRSRGGRRDAPRNRELAELSRLRLARLVRGVFGRSCCVCSSLLCAFESRRGAFLRCAT